MKFSEAFMLGITTCKLLPRDVNSCAFGCALNAMGVPQVANGKRTVDTIPRYRELARLWPWLSTGAEIGMGIMREPVPSAVGESIYTKFDEEVCTGKMTLEELHDYIKSVEPECECCRSRCDCAEKAARPELSTAPAPSPTDSVLTYTR
jgi:hypothetical protein